MTAPIMLHQKAFWVMSFFLVGVGLRSLTESVSYPLLSPLLLSVFILVLCLAFRQYLYAMLACALFLGIGYYQINVVQFSSSTSLAGSVSFTALAQKVQLGDKSQRVFVRTEAGQRLLLTAQMYPSIAYGDMLFVSGAVQSVDKDNGYLRKERVSGQISFPTIEIVSRGNGSPIRAWLCRLRDAVAQSFARTLSPEQATLMTGLTLGKSGGLSDEFEEKLKATGTTHLVALSGYNMSVVSVVLASVLGLWFSRRITFWLCLIALVLFTLMTGAEASVVRAAIMAIIMLVADRSGRLHSIKNAIVFAACLMVLWNPFILVFDIGFQLSFLAFMGIAYLKPALTFLVYRRMVEPGLLRWRENLWTTIAAQLMVLPLLLGYFGQVAALSILPNMLILALTPLTMGWGFAIAGVSLLSHYLALLVALPARLLLSYELGVINVFARFPLALETTISPIVWSPFYYGLLVWLIFWATHRRAAVQ